MKAELPAIRVSFSLLETISNQSSGTYLQTRVMFISHHGFSHREMSSESKNISREAGRAATRARVPGQGCGGRWCSLAPLQIPEKPALQRRAWGQVAPKREQVAPELLPPVDPGQDADLPPGPRRGLARSWSVWGAVPLPFPSGVPPDTRGQGVSRCIPPQCVPLCRLLSVVDGGLLTRPHSPDTQVPSKGMQV